MAYKGTLTNKSKWGAFVSTKKPFSGGQNIIIASLSQDNKIKEKSTGDEGIGVKYENADFSLNARPGF